MAHISASSRACILLSLSSKSSPMASGVWGWSVDGGIGIWRPQLPRHEGPR